MKAIRFLDRATLLLPAIGFGCVLLGRCLLWGNVADDEQLAFSFSLIFFAVFSAALYFCWKKELAIRLLENRRLLPILFGLALLMRIGTVLVFHHLTPKTDSATYLSITELYNSVIRTSAPGSAAVLAVVLWLLLFGLFLCLLPRVRHRPKMQWLRRWGRWVPLAAAAVVALLSLLIQNGLVPGKDYFSVPFAQSVTPNILTSYMSVFPHFLGYPSMLVWADVMTFHLFTPVTLAQVTNVVLSLMTGGFLTLTARNLRGRKTGLLALLIWTLWPSQFLYVATPLAEVTYVFWLMAAFCAASFAVKHRDRPKRALFPLCCAAVLCALANFIRPFAMVALLALLIWFALSTLSRRPPKRELWIPAAALGACLFLFFGLGAFSRLMETKAIGREPAGFAMGWNVLDGSHEASLGKWNAEDAAVFKPLYEQVQRGELTPDQLHRQLFDLGVTRMKDRGLANWPFWGKKILDLWSRDEVAFTHAAAMKPELGLQDNAVSYHLVRGLCNGFYMAMLLCLVIGLTLRFRRAPKRPVQFGFGNALLLYILGMALAHMILEQSQRYAYPAISLMIVVLADLSIEFLRKPEEKPYRS